MPGPVANAERRDPTRTATLRAEYAHAAKKRFNAVKKVIRETVVENDALGLSTVRGPLSAFGAAIGSTGLQGAEAARRYDFPSDPAGKVGAFMDWLREQVDAGILETEEREGPRITLRREWQNVYVRAAYAKGIERADALLARTGMEIPRYEVWSVLQQGMHAEALGLLYVRNFETLKGITEAMGSEIARTLVEGMGRGLNPKQVGKLIAGRVDKVGVYRGTLMARTEIVRAHAESTLNRFEEFGLRNVVNMAEWQTAGDQRVCPLCAQLQGRTFTIQEARGMLPLHPNCRCTWLPVLAEILTGNIRGRNFLGRNYRVFSGKIPGGVYRR